ncbi:MAG: hypothetical protein GF381_03975 [Candidatus Pacebacteria bacterium]|nr:hypothetical protein [Candidatus Paceibacterota bacterium]
MKKVSVSLFLAAIFFSFLSFFGLRSSQNLQLGPFTNLMRQVVLTQEVSAQEKLTQAQDLEDSEVLAQEKLDKESPDSNESLDSKESLDSNADSADANTDSTDTNVDNTTSPTAFSTQVQVHLFGSASCPHCIEEKQFWREYLADHPQVVVYDYLVEHRDNARLMALVVEELGIQGGGVPLTVIGREAVVGFGSAQTTGKALDELVQTQAENQIQEPSKETTLDIETLAERNNLQPRRDRIKAHQQPSEPEPIQPAKLDSEKEKIINVPFFDQLNLEKLSLPILSVVLGLIDGFNPCAMWALLFLISLLLGMEDRRRMWLLGSAFILASGVVYFLFMTAWLNFFLFVGFLKWVRLLIGAVALGAGGYYLYDYWTNKDGACKVQAGGKKKKVFNQLKEVAYRPQLILALAGMVALAFAVNLVELVCSAGLPAVFTQILSMSSLSGWEYYSYILLYILFFMLDDLLVFFVAMTTLNRMGLNSKYARYSHLIGGILMFLIGLAMWFKPELLTFG